MKILQDSMTGTRTKHDEQKYQETTSIIYGQTKQVKTELITP
jgi:hypothetical protein